MSSIIAIILAIIFFVAAIILQLKERSQKKPGMAKSGNFGCDVRQQVFEVIVGQAMAGAQWQSMFANAMVINDISALEIEAEVNRRRSAESCAP